MRIRMVEAATGQPTPAMISITGSDGSVRLPPDGRIPARLSSPPDFYYIGGRYDPDPIELKRKIDRSQWLVASGVCENGALAHATPIYVVVDGLPTWSTERGPAIARKQLRIIDQVGREFVNSPEDAVGMGVHEQLQRARTYYSDLLARMESQAASSSTTSP